LPDRLLLAVWIALSAASVEAQRCSTKPATFTVTTPADVQNLLQVALCPNATISVIWKGTMQPSKTIVVGNGTSLTVTGDAIETSVINGGGKIQLFDVWGKLTLVNMTLTHGFVKINVGGGGAIIVQPSAELNITSSTFKNNIATVPDPDFQFGAGGAIYTSSNATLTITGSTFGNNSAAGDGGFGGAIFADVTTTLTITSSTFDINSDKVKQT
jgi:hypothetical protein